MIQSSVARSGALINPGMPESAAIDARKLRHRRTRSEMPRTVIELRTYSAEQLRHRHDFHQIILPYSGILEIEMEHRTGRVDGSIGSFVPAGCDHAFLARQPNAFLVIDVPMGSGAQAMDDQSVPPFFAVGPDIHGLIDYMLTGQQIQLSHALRDAWSTLLLERLNSQVRHPSRAEIAVTRAIAFMKRMLAEPIRMADVAQAAGVSLSSLHRAFVEQRATTPHAKLLSMRLDSAEQLLADPRLSIAEVAIRSGHADQSALTRAMRRERSSTPAEVRRRLMGGAAEKA